MHRIARVTLAAVLAGLCLAATASASYDAHTVLVKFAPHTTAAQRAALGASDIVGSVQGLGVQVVRVGSPTAAVAALNRSPLVQYAELNQTLTASADAERSALRASCTGSTTPARPAATPDADIDAPEGWDAAGLGAFPATGRREGRHRRHGHPRRRTRTSSARSPTARKSQGVAADPRRLDPGGQLRRRQRPRHPRRRARSPRTPTTARASQASPSTRRSAICKALGGPLGQGSTADVANCITWAHDKGAKVISMSLGGGDSTTLQQRGQTTRGPAAAPAGPCSSRPRATTATRRSTTRPATPRSCSVAATDNNDAARVVLQRERRRRGRGAGRQRPLDLQLERHGYTTLSGTSMATPHVAGVTAIIWDKYPTATASTIRVQARRRGGRPRRRRARHDVRIRSREPRQGSLAVAIGH